MKREELNKRIKDLYWVDIYEDESEHQKATLKLIGDCIKAVTPEPSDMSRYEGTSAGIDIQTFDSDEDPTGTKTGEQLAHLAQFTADQGFNEAVDAVRAKTKELLDA